MTRHAASDRRALRRPGSSIGLPFNELYYSTAILGGAAVIGGISTYNLEHALRTNFLETRLLNELAERDGMTGLYNRRIFDDYMQRLWRQSRRDGTGGRDHFRRHRLLQDLQRSVRSPSGRRLPEARRQVHRARCQAAVRFRGALRRRRVRAGAVRAARRVRAQRCRSRFAATCSISRSRTRARRRRSTSRSAWVCRCATRDDPQPGGRDPNGRRSALSGQARRPQSRRVQGLRRLDVETGNFRVIQRDLR